MLVFFVLLFCICTVTGCSSEIFREDFNGRVLEAGKWTVLGATLPMTSVHLAMENVQLNNNELVLNTSVKLDAASRLTGASVYAAENIDFQPGLEVTLNVRLPRSPFTVASVTLAESQTTKVYLRIERIALIQWQFLASADYLDISNKSQNSTATYESAKDLSAGYHTLQLLRTSLGLTWSLDGNLFLNLSFSQARMFPKLHLILMALPQPAHSDQISASNLTEFLRPENNEFHVDHIVVRNSTCIILSSCAKLAFPDWWLVHLAFVIVSVFYVGKE